MARPSVDIPTLSPSQQRQYDRLRKQLEALPLLAQGSVFAIEPPPDAPRASTRYVWTRKVKAKTVTRALTQEQYQQLKQAIEANRKLEDTLKEMRAFSLKVLVGSAADTRPRRRRKLP